MQRFGPATGWPDGRGRRQGDRHRHRRVDLVQLSSTRGAPGDHDPDQPRDRAGLTDRRGQGVNDGSRRPDRVPRRSVPVARARTTRRGYTEHPACSSAAWSRARPFAKVGIVSGDIVTKFDGKCSRDGRPPDGARHDEVAGDSGRSALGRSVRHGAPGDDHARQRPAE